jgi:predicted metal-dependent peptidase
MFTEKDYDNLAGLLKPLGGGGTHVSSVSEYIVENGIKAECVLVFTDGYVESNIKWEITSPTLWMITHNRGFTPPVGKSVMFNRD